MNGIVEAFDLMKSYRTDGGDVHALRGVNIAIERGEMVAVMGPSGCGKTTLLNTLSGIDDITSGKVLVDGVSLHDMSDSERTRFRASSMGFVFQAFNLIPVLTAVENIELPLLLGGSKQSAARIRAIELLSLVELEDQANKRPAEMSGGQQQRVTIARALANNPAIVWADEPTAALDSETGKSVMDILCRLNEERKQTFILVTHDETVGARAQRIVRMRDGLIDSDRGSNKK